VKAARQRAPPTFKICMREYEDMAIKVGDKITIKIKKSDSSGGI
jgi:hypothetical protein